MNDSGPRDAIQDARGTIPLPKLGLLARPETPAGTDREAEAGFEALTRVFAQFDINATVVGYVRGPAAVTYEVRPGPKASIARIIAYAKNIEYAMPGAVISTDPVEQRVTVQAPSRTQTRVRLGSLLEPVRPIM